MSKQDKTQAGPAKDIKAANDHALVKFPKPKLRKAFEAIAQDANVESEAAENRSGAAFNVLVLAHQFALDNAESTVENIVDGWRDAMGGLCMELATAGNKFAELKPGKDEKPTTAKFTGYGNNVVSIAKGILEFELDPSKLLNEDGETGFKVARRIVEQRRQARRRELNPELAAMKDATAQATEAWNELRKAVSDFGDLTTMKALRAAIREMRDRFNDDIKAARKVEEDQAKAKEAAQTAANEAAKRGEKPAEAKAA